MDLAASGERRAHRLAARRAERAGRRDERRAVDLHDCCTLGGLATGQVLVRGGPFELRGERASASERITHSNYVGLMNLKFASFYLGRGAERRRSGARFEGIDPAVVEVFDLDDFVDVGRAAEVGQHLIAVARARPDHAVVREPREAQRGETVAGQAVLLSSRAARYRGARERESGECEGASLCSDRITSSELSVELRSPNTPPSAPERTPVTSSWSAEAAAFFTFTDHAGSSLSTIKLTN